MNHHDANIRFAQPPVGKLRLRKPQLPLPSNDTVQTAIVPKNSTNCINSIPPGFELAPGVGGTTWGNGDCLFLDVKVPESSFGQKFPVLLWYHGGGYFFGSKEPWAGDPAPLFQQITPQQKFIAVSSNYRLSALGWLSPDENGVDKNVGLFDALAALQWVKQYISYFGGDPDNIIIIGESAGGGIVEHLLTAYNGSIDMGIAKAILTSPGRRPNIDRQADFDAQFQTFLAALNCTDVTCMQTASEDSMKIANWELISNFNLSGGWIGPGIGYGGPVIDGDVVQDIPWRQFQKGLYQKSTKVLVGTMLNDEQGAVVLPASNWTQQLSYFMKTPTAEAVNRVAAAYPSNLTVGFDLFAGDAVFKCPANFATQAYGTHAYRYEMSIPPAQHSQDQFYYF